MSERVFYYQPDGRIAVWTDISGAFEFFDATIKEIANDKKWSVETVERLLEDAGSAEDFIKAVKIIKIEFGVDSDEYKDVRHWDNEYFEPVTLERAVEILNANNYGGCSDWKKDSVFTDNREIFISNGNFDPF